MAVFEITYQDLSTPHIDTLLHLFENQLEITSDWVDLDFAIAGRTRHTKRSPTVRRAAPSDAAEITKIYLEVYEGRYP